MRDSYMLRTVAECEAALKRLELERAHILKVREFLEENGPQLFTPIKAKSTQNTVLKIVTSNPGIDGQAVRKLLEEAGFAINKRQAQSSLSRLALKGEIENRGRHGLGARWYIKE